MRLLIAVLEPFRVQVVCIPSQGEILPSVSEKLSYL